MFIKPAAGLPVLDPITRRPIPDEGIEVPESTYWLRRVRGGDVSVVPAPTKVVQVVNPIPDSSEEHR